MNFFFGVGDGENKKKWSVFTGMAPDATSYKLMKHIVQQSVWPGYHHNQKLLDHKEPKEYDLKPYPSDKVKTLLYAGMDDSLVSYLDMRWLRDQISIKGDVEYEEVKGFGHYTYFFPKKDMTVNEEVLFFLLS